MLIINKNSNNTLTLTLREKATLTTPYYLFVFNNDITNQSVTFTANDLSYYTQRYNQFLVTETSGTNNYSSGVITLSPTGFWSYKIYEMSDGTNLNVSNVTSLVEEGKVEVKGTDTTYNKYVKERTYKVYGKGSS